MHVFKSKIDKAILLCLIFSIVACLLGISGMPKIGGGVNYAIAIFLLAFGVGFPLWIMLSTKHIVTDETLQIISGHFGRNIPIIKYGEEKLFSYLPRINSNLYKNSGAASWRD